MRISTDANLLQSPFEDVIDVDLTQGMSFKLLAVQITVLLKNIIACKSCVNLRVVRKFFSCVLPKTFLIGSLS